MEKSNRSNSPVEVWPVGADGRLSTEDPSSGRLQKLTRDRVDIVLDTEADRGGMALLIGLTSDDVRPSYAGITIDSKPKVNDGQVTIFGKFGGPAERMMLSEWLLPKFDPVTKAFSYEVDEQVIGTWVKGGMYKSKTLDQVQVCPRCGRLPSYRLGCRQCLSGRTHKESQFHHYACSHVGSVQSFEMQGELVCPKCRARHIVVGVDYECIDAYRCDDCGWVESQREMLGHCLECDHRFPSTEARQIDLIGYKRCVKRFDPLVLVAER